jgi:hypothetical protein
VGRVDWGCGLMERGDEKVRTGLGREVLSSSEGGDSRSVSEDEEMTEAFLLRSARVGGNVGGVTCTIQ